MPPKDPTFNLTLDTWATHMAAGIPSEKDQRILDILILNQKVAAMEAVERAVQNPEPAPTNDWDDWLIPPRGADGCE